jgi:Undecaprenyl-phosphate galactose phosphotransferase WbaP
VLLKTTLAEKIYFSISEGRLNVPAGAAPTARLLLLLAVDVTALLVCGCFSYYSWGHLLLRQPVSIYVNLIFFLLLIPLGYAAAGLYPGFGVGAVETLRRFSYCTTFGFLALAAASFALKLPAYYSRMTFGIAWLLSLAAVPTFRFLLLSSATEWPWWDEPAVLVGEGQWLAKTIIALRGARSIGYRVVGVLQRCDDTQDDFVDGIPVLGGLDLMPELAAHGVKVVIVDDSADLRTLDGLQRHFRHVVMIRRYDAEPIERFRAFNLGGLLGIEFTNNLLRPRNLVFKRILDCTAGTVLFLCAAPIVLMAGIVIKVMSPGPIFYSQQREGLDGKPITVWKLRTMYVDADRRLEELLRHHPHLSEQWQKQFKLKHDPRIIKHIGNFLRRFSIDELPQLWSVVSGKMSLVGPRPFPYYHLERFRPEFRHFRQCVRPGLTGMWQVMVRSDGGIEEQELFDAYYIRNWSLWLDLYLLGRTVLVVVSGRGAY